MMDPYDDFLLHDHQQALKEARWPKCPICGCTLEDTAYRIEDRLLCWDCAYAWLEQQEESVYEEDE